MKTKMLVAILVFIILASCASPVTIKPTEKPISAATSTLALPPTSTPFPKPCISLPKTGLPVGDSIKNSHILYQTDKINLFSLNDNTISVLDNVKGTTLGFAFLPDRKRFVLRDGDGNARIADIENSLPAVVPVSKELLDNFRPYSVFWSVLQEGDQQIYSDAFGFYKGRFYPLGFFSPDGQVVATWQRGDPALFLTDKEKDRSIKIMTTGVRDTIIGNWTLDGSQFIFAYIYGSTEDYYSQLYTVNRDGSELRPLTMRFEKSVIGEVKLSPNSEKVLMVNFGFPRSDVFAILTIPTNDLKIFEQGIDLSSSLMEDNNIVWSPDSEWIAFFAHWGQIDIRALNVENGDTYCVTNDNSIENMMDWR